MKRFIHLGMVFLFALLWFVACSKSEEEQRARFTPEQRAEQLKQRLDLTDEQADMIKQIYVDSDKKMAEFREKFPMPRPGERPERGTGERLERRPDGQRPERTPEQQAQWMEMRTQMMAMRAETDSLVRDVLFEDQIPLYEAYQEEMRENFRQRFQQRNQE